MIRSFVVFLTLSVLALAEGDPFTVTTPIPAGTPAPGESQWSETAAIADLKKQAIIQWLQGYAAEKAASLSSQVTRDFAERYILDYRLSRSGTNKELIELSGHIDSDSLRKWIRVSEVKRQGSDQVRPVLVIGSTVPGLGLNPSQTASSVQDSSFARVVYAFLVQEFGRLNTKLALNTASISLGAPPKSERDLSILKDAVGRQGYNTAVWVELGQCATCESPRVDMYLFGLTNPRMVTVQSDDIALPKPEWGNTERLKAELQKVFQQFHQELDSAVGDGRLFSRPLTLVVEGIGSYRGYRTLEGSLGRQDFMTQVTLKQVAGKSAEYEFLTSLSSEEIARRLQQAELSGIHLKPVRVDSRVVVVRYQQ